MASLSKPIITRLDDCNCTEGLGFRKTGCTWRHKLFTHSVHSICSWQFHFIVASTEYTKGFTSNNKPTHYNCKLLGNMRRLKGSLSGHSHTSSDFLSHFYNLYFIMQRLVRWKSKRHLFNIKNPYLHYRSTIWGLGKNQLIKFQIYN